MRLDDVQIFVVPRHEPGRRRELATEEIAHLERLVRPALLVGGRQAPGIGLFIRMGVTENDAASGVHPRAQPDASALISPRSRDGGFDDRRSAS